MEGLLFLYIPTKFLHHCNSIATSMETSLGHFAKRSNQGGRGQAWTHRGSDHGPGRSFRGARMTGPARRGPFGLNARPSSYMIAKAHQRTNSFPWKHDLSQDSPGAEGIPRIGNSSKLHISNLDYGVSKDDIKELFCGIGDLERFAIHYNGNGQPSGSAEVVYKRRRDAVVALKRYNSVMLDGKLMKIDIMGANAEIPISARVNVTGMNGWRKSTVAITPGPTRRGGFAALRSDSGRSRQGAMRNVGDGSGRGWIRGQSRFQGKRRSVKSVDELNKELDSYRAEA